MSGDGSRSADGPAPSVQPHYTAVHEQGAEEPVLAAAVPSHEQPGVGETVDHTCGRAAQEAEEKLTQYTSN